MAPPPQASEAGLDAVVGGPEALPGAEAGLSADGAPLALAPPDMNKQLAQARELAKTNPLAAATILRSWFMDAEA